MKRSGLLFLSYVMSVALASCGDDKQHSAPSSAGVSGQQSASHPAKTVSWFIAHREELQVILKACRDNPGELAKTSDCVNASTARDKITVQEMKDALK